MEEEVGGIRKVFSNPVSILLDLVHGIFKNEDGLVWNFGFDCCNNGCSLCFYVFMNLVNNEFIDLSSCREGWDSQLSIIDVAASFESVFSPLS